MAGTLESALNLKSFRNIVKRDVELEGIRELYGNEVLFLGVNPFFAEYGFLPKKTYLVLPHFKEKFSVYEREYSADTITLKLRGDEKGKIEPMDYLHDNGDDSYDLPPFITVKRFDGYYHVCSSRFENSEYIELRKTTKKIKACFSK